MLFPVSRHADREQSPPSSAWERALSAASRLSSPRLWRAELARTIHDAIGADELHSVAVVASPSGHYDRFDVAIWPETPADSIARWAREALAQFGRDYPWRQIVATHGVLYPARLAMPAPVAASFERMLASVGAAGCVIALAVSHDARRAEDTCCAYLALHTLSDEAEFIARHRAPLTDLMQAMGTTITAALALAREHDMRPPEPSVAELTHRERTIADLVSQGLSDLNIAARLGIAESTVGTHLHRVFRKLGVHTRVELVRVLERPEPT